MKRYIEPNATLISNTVDKIGFYLWLESRKEIISIKIPELSDTWFDELPEEFKVGGEVINKNVYYDRVDKLNLQYNNFDSLVYRIEGSCLFRDILFNLNKVGQWAVSNRFLFSIIPLSDVPNEENYPISAEYKGIPEWEAQFDKYIETIKSDPIVDNNRMEMPYSISSSFWVIINKRTLVEIMSYLKYNAPFFYEVYGKFFDVKIPGNLQSPSILQYRHSEVPQVESTNQIGDISIVTSKMGLILYSQFIRQTDSIIKGLYNIIEHKDANAFSHEVFKGNTEFMITYVADKLKLNKTVSNRLCAFAMSSKTDPSSWSYFINKFLPDGLTPIEFSKLLPCSYSYERGKACLTHCKFHDDIKFRNEGKEVSNIPCPLAVNSMKVAELKKARDNNKIGDYYYELTQNLISGTTIKSDLGEVWTSNLSIQANRDFTSDSGLEVILNDFKSKTRGTKDNFPELAEYFEYGIGDDITCMCKGWAIDVIAEYLISNGENSFLINFGGDIFGYNTHQVIKIEGTKFQIKASGTFSIFTSGNTSKRGNHIIGGNPGEFMTAYVNWDADQYGWSNLGMDIITTKLFANEQIDTLGYPDLNIIKFNEEGKLLSNAYCASPFFDENQIQIRDKMASQFVNLFRPDLTEASKAYSQGDSSSINEIYLENVRNVEMSDVLVFPKNTSDLGTLYEVGYAMACKVLILVYNEETDVYSLIPPYEYKVTNIPMLFDLSKKSHAISMGYASKFCYSHLIKYQLNGSRDNIMMAANFVNLEMIDGKLTVIDKSNARPD